MSTGFQLFLGKIGPNCPNHPNDVRIVQSLLQKAKVYEGDAHGYCDMATVFAIRRYQSGFMYQPDGRVEIGSETWKRLLGGKSYHPFGFYDPYAVRPLPYETEEEEKNEGTIVTKELMEQYLGKNMENDICSRNYDGGNNCAHFVSHVLRIRVGHLCDQRKPEAKHLPTSVSIKVQEIYNSLDAIKKGRLSIKGELLGHVEPKNGMLVFVCPKSYVLSNNTMDNRPNKHVGIYCDGIVYHYGNTKKKVVSDVFPDGFLRKFRHVYKHSDKDPVELFYGFL